ncbi:hypothetical protein K2173_001136 [Erythroxylum novogranatense]|uniref:Zinc-finger domain-containing protein n=1 Tax=Erythroxylum novogranatense TaxID=1862640 RepID=A0AAV8TI77_9ROSI|nr:hypothetical protein K2173_001136 [Erythroxylum novogranatense]
MVSRRRNAEEDAANAENTNNYNGDDTAGDLRKRAIEKKEAKGSNGLGYEELRDRRIRENKDRMQKLGLFELSLKLKPQPKKTPQDVSSPKRKPQNALPAAASPRRSSRLKCLTPVNYKERERPIKIKIELSEDVEIRILEGSQPEVYTEEHEKLLGDSKTSWTLCVDGYDSDGNRMYDPEKGESCHQCRQKIRCLHTHCSKCNTVQGQFCGDCLYTRYGENVIEVNENPSWICPACRDICNCSRCRKGKGWRPTGCIYKRVSKLGFKSVAHYLIQTQRGQSCSADSRIKGLVSEEGTLLSANTDQLNEFHNAQPKTDQHKMEKDVKQEHYSDSSYDADADHEDDAGDDSGDSTE